MNQDLGSKAPAVGWVPYEVLEFADSESDDDDEELVSSHITMGDEWLEEHNSGSTEVELFNVPTLDATETV